MAKRRTLILDGKTIKKIVTMKEALRAVEKGFKFYGQGKVQMPPKVYIHLDKYHGDFRAMPAHVDGFKASGIKWVNVHPENRKKGLPTVMAIMILSDPTTGFPLCVMDATHATALRTGAAGGVAAKYLARSDSKKVALVGCGIQAQAQLAALNENFNIKEVSVWGVKPAEVKRFIKRAGKRKKFKMKPAPTVRSCVEDSDIIVTTTPSRKPLVRPEWIKKGTHINAIGADARGKQELDARILKKARVVVDAWEQASHSGEINVPLRKKQLSKKDVCANIGEIVAGKKKGRKKRDDITVFDSTGLAVQDIAIAYLVYRKARRLGKGKFIELT
ncbi:MAG: alanine dehydrogenase [Candidatus Omnitrophota bacterium]